ncbi:unnamed protein product, partial [Rotaria socialis]
DAFVHSQINYKRLEDTEPNVTEDTQCTLNKKKKRFGQEYESGDLSDEYGEAEDEVEKYLSMRIDPELIVDNPLIFWKANQKHFPLLSKVARTIHCIPATTAAVEREFSGGGLVMSERRSSINPNNVDNILFLRSVTQ